MRASGMRRAFTRCLAPLLLVSALAMAQVEPPAHALEHGGGEESGGNDATVAVITITCLVIISILFEVFTEMLRESTDETNMPFVNTIFSELTTLGFIGLMLFVITRLDVLSRISLAYLGEKEKLLETIELLHMGLFLFIIIFLVLCCGLLKLGTIAQNEWREFERSATDIPSVVSDYVLATEPPRTWRERLSISRWLAASKAKREIVYLSLRRRFLDYRSNHPNPEIAMKNAKEFQRNPDTQFPFNEYLNIISGEVMGRLIQIDFPTWIALEVFLVAVLIMCWNVGHEGEIWVLLLCGLGLVISNEYVHHLILRMRRLLTPPRMLKDAERLRRKNEWRAKHQLPLVDVNEKTWIMEDFLPPYLETLPNGGLHMTEQELARAQRSLVGGSGNGVKLALFSTRLVFLLTAMHLSIFLMRTMHQVYTEYSGWLAISTLFLLFLLPSILVTGMSVKIARDGLYSFNVEHLKATRIIAKVMRILKARQTLRTLRFVAEMKIYIKENVRRASSLHASPKTSSAVPITAKLHEASSMYAKLLVRKTTSPKGAIGASSPRGASPTAKSPSSPAQSSTRTLDQARRLSTTSAPQRPPSPLSLSHSGSNLASPPLSPLAAYTTPREKRSDAYKLEMERREINTIFCLFDTDGSGSVSRDEMGNLLRAITHDLEEPQLNRLMEDLIADQENKDEVTFESFYNWCHRHIRESHHSKEELIEEIFHMVDADGSGFITEIFHMVDADGSGFITVDEFIAIFKTLGQSLDHDDVRELVYQMDRNDDGKIDLEEFAKMLHKHEV
ncbi:hypothetical protein ATCC90586_000197 [Pythium insidiosum]|nr:hypothetical protein ATCC90586_000197 [Pythium insidiosum]